MKKKIISFIIAFLINLTAYFIILQVANWFIIYLDF